MRAPILMIVLASSLAGCALWDMVNPFSQSGLSVDAELTVGDKNQTVNTAVGETSNTADTMNIVNESHMPLWAILFGISGWILPRPQTMWKSFSRRKSHDK